MGGSGGSFYFGSDFNPEDVSKKIREEEEKTKNESFEIEVSGLLKNILASANSRDADLIQKHLRTVESAIHFDLDGLITLRYGGSISKHTFVDGLSDVDSLAIINNSELNNSSPEEVKDFFYQNLQRKLPNSKIEVGNLAITIKFNSGTEVQIIPALKTQTGIKIPSSRQNNEWSKLIKPDAFAKLLRYSNSQLSGKLIPVIKLAKTLIANFPETRRLSGYHVECLAIEVFKSYNGTHNPKEMIKHFFSEGSKNILNPIKDKTGQSVHVDDYLNEANSISRKMVADSMSSISRKMNNADGSRDIRLWEQILK
ncbi:nucleotidyltransferase [Flavobacterium alkalisoli]|uniref:Nucleotidyltransferase n=1 Tax=Flavobacterium alkalisoli TaxID=2602769 RepID=A0A5B9FQK4_9FLAO|nr:CBASS oligonucleotide cyclase [Flavobacterium alkalisoli]QEE49115.1 nucleotidyltransferase [Flavobacterium alkalisoli]